MLRLSFAPSRQLFILLIAAHLLGIASVWAIDVGAGTKALVSVAVIGSCIYSVRRHALLRAPYSIIGMLLKADGSVEVGLQSGATLQGRQVPGGFAHPWFTAVVWRAENARFSRAVAVLPDSLPAAQFRELRVWLKWRRVENLEKKNL